MNIIIQTCVPAYRINFYNHLVATTIGINIISGKEFYTPSVKSDKNTPNVIWVKNFFFLKRNFLYQTLPYIKIIKADKVVIEFNLRNISFYIVFFLRLMFFKNIYLWGHAWSRNGRKSSSEIFRYVFKSLSSGYITYTLKQKLELKNQLKNKKIFTACNAIYYEKEMLPNIINEEKITDFIYVGRLVKEKKVYFLLEAYHNIMHKLPKESKLIIIGSGPEYDTLFNYMKNNNLSENVKLLGHISNYETLKSLYSKSIASISPGYVGLSITQSLGFGVPMIISKDEQHSPEIEAANKNNSVFFKTDNKNDLSIKLLDFFSQKSKWINKRKEISTDCRDNYSVEKMTSPFIKIFNS